MREGLALIGWGTAFGFAGIFILGRVIRSFLFGVNAFDPITLSIVAGLLVASALIACHIPARYASRIDPMEALRSE